MANKRLHGIARTAQTMSLVVQAFRKSLSKKAPAHRSLNKAHRAYEGHRRSFRRSKGMNMTRLIIAAAVCLLAFGVSSAQAGKGVKESSMEHFAELKEAEWKQVFHDPCTRNWKDKWTLDGLKATVTNSTKGMDFTAGPEAFNDAHHAVLWTKQAFKGDLKIEYEYTRLDEELRMVNILYIQATGRGKEGFQKDIGAWAEKRTIPSMKTYFNNMNAYHISYAAFGTKNKVSGKDYIRARRYMCEGLKGTKLNNEYKKTGLFEPGVPHKITIIKRDLSIYMHIQNAQKEMLCHFVNSKFPPITEGKIGLRHMYTRGAGYKDFKVSVLAKDEPDSKLSNKALKATR
jgi:hypothetical protein